jgi:hypothetical protein
MSDAPPHSTVVLPYGIILGSGAGLRISRQASAGSASVRIGPSSVRNSPQCLHFLASVWISSGHRFTPSLMAPNCNGRSRGERGPAGRCYQTPASPALKPIPTESVGIRYEILAG